MSQYKFYGHNDDICDHEITIGWGLSLETFFSQVAAADAAGKAAKQELLFWIGSFEHELTDPQELRLPLAPYCEVTESPIQTLRKDRTADIVTIQNRIRQLKFDNTGRSSYADGAEQ